MRSVSDHPTHRRRPAVRQHALLRPDEWHPAGCAGAWTIAAKPMRLAAEGDTGAKGLHGAAQAKPRSLPAAV